MSEIEQYLRTVKLPVMPEVAHALIETLNNPEADISAVQQIIAKDPGLTANLLRMANSAIFGLSRSVSSLDSAITVVGMNQIRARALAICVANAFVMPAGLARLEFWQSSMVCAGYAKWLAGKVGIDEQQAWLAGMMLRLGELTIAQHNPRLLETIEQMPRAPGERWTRETSVLGFDEGNIMSEIARRWDFPEALCEGLEAAARPLDAPTWSKLGGVVHLAGLLADMFKPAAENLQELPPKVVGALNLDLGKLAKSMPSSDSFVDVSALLGG